MAGTKTNAGNFFEDFRFGQLIHHATPRTVTDGDVALYTALYVLLSVEAFALLIGSLMLFAALAAVMYLTRNLDWGGEGALAA